MALPDIKCNWWKDLGAIEAEGGRWWEGGLMSLWHSCFRKPWENGPALVEGEQGFLSRISSHQYYLNKDQIGME
jgi:hypothetical protein